MVRRASGVRSAERRARERRQHNRTIGSDDETRSLRSASRCTGTKAARWHRIAPLRRAGEATSDASRTVQLHEGVEMRRACIALVITIGVTTLVRAEQSAEQSNDELAKKTQNPIQALY